MIRCGERGRGGDLSPPGETATSGDTPAAPNHKEQPNVKQQPTHPPQPQLFRTCPTNRWTGTTEHTPPSETPPRAGFVCEICNEVVPPIKTLAEITKELEK